MRVFGTLASIIVWATALKISQRNGVGWNEVLQAEQGRRAGPERTQTDLGAWLRRNAPLLWCRRAGGSGSCGGSSAPSACPGGADGGDDDAAPAARCAPPRTNWNAGTSRHTRPPRALSASRCSAGRAVSGPSGDAGLGQRPSATWVMVARSARERALVATRTRYKPAISCSRSTRSSSGERCSAATRVRITSQTQAMVATSASRTRRALPIRTRAVVARSASAAIRSIAANRAVRRCRTSSASHGRPLGEVEEMVIVPHAADRLTHLLLTLWSGFHPSRHRLLEGSALRDMAREIRRATRPSLALRVGVAARSTAGSAGVRRRGRPGHGGSARGGPGWSPCSRRAGHERGPGSDGPPSRRGRGPGALWPGRW